MEHAQKLRDCLAAPSEAKNIEFARKVLESDAPITLKSGDDPCACPPTGYDTMRIMRDRYEVGSIMTEDLPGDRLKIADFKIDVRVHHHGFGRKAMDLLKSWAVQAGYQEICGRVQEYPPEAAEKRKKFFKVQGFEIQDMNLSFKLQKPSG